MADRRITELTELTDVADGDKLVIVDVSDTTAAASGTSKYATVDSVTGQYVENVRGYGALGDGSTDDTVAIQAALDAAKTSGLAVYVPPGTYMVENLTVTTADSFHIYGASGSIIKLRNDDALGGVGQILLVTDVNEVSINSLKFHGNQANSKSGDGNSPLVELTQSAAMAGIRGCTVSVNNVQFTESAGGYGHIYIKSYETSAASYGFYDQVDLKKIRCISPGAAGIAVRLRGAMGTVRLTDMYAQNDGVYGFPVRAGGIALSSFTVSAEVGWNHYIENVYVDGLDCYRTTGSLFYQMVKNHHTQNVSVREGCTNPYFDVAAQDVTNVNTATDTITAPVPAGTVNGSICIFKTSGTLPDPLVADYVYYAIGISGNDFQISLTPTGSAIDITDAGTGTHTVEWPGLEYSSLMKEDDCKFDPTRPGTHLFQNLRFIDSSPHRSLGEFSVEESSPGTATPVHIVDSSIHGTLTFPGYYVGERHKLERCRLGGTNPNYTYDVAPAVMSWSGGDLIGCEFRKLGFSISVLRDTNIERCKFHQGAAFTFSGDGCRLHLSDNEWNTADGASTFIDFTNPASGAFKVNMVRNHVNGSNVNGIDMRRFTGGADTTVTYYLEDNDMGLDSFGASQDTATQIVSRNNTGMTRENAHFPFITLADSATPSIVGVTAAKTGGTTAITDFTGEINNERILIYIETGHQVNDTATIVTKAGANIAGPAVREFVAFDNVWYEV